MIDSMVDPYHRWQGSVALFECLLQAKHLCSSSDYIKLMG